MKDGHTEAGGLILPCLPSRPHLPSLLLPLLFSSIASLHVSTQIVPCKERQRWRGDLALNPNTSQQCHSHFWNVFDQKLLLENGFQQRSSLDCQGNLTDTQKSNPFAVTEETGMNIIGPDPTSNCNRTNRWQAVEEAIARLTPLDLPLLWLMKGSKSD